MEAPFSRIQKALDADTGVDWNGLYKRLRFFAYIYFWWVPSKTGGVLDVDDLVQEAMTKVIEGKRDWPKHVDLFVLLCGVICSKVSHLPKNRMLPIEEVRKADTLTSSPSAQQERVQQEQAFQRLRDKILKEVCDDSDPVLTLILKAWIEEPDLKPQGIAAQLRLSIEDVRNAQKRLRTKVKKLRKKRTDIQDERR